MHKFDTRIKTLRKALRLSQSKMAEELEIHVQTLSRYERGELTPSADILAKISLRHNVNPTWLLLGFGDMFQSIADNSVPAKKVETNKDISKLSFLDMTDVLTQNYTTILDESNFTITQKDLEFLLGKRSPEEKDEYLNFTHMYMKKCHHLILPRIGFFKNEGNTMEPTFLSGDYIVFDRRMRSIKNGAIYLLSINEIFSIKRILITQKGHYVLKVDNPNYETEEINREELQTLNIGGQVIGYLRHV